MKRTHTTRTLCLLLALLMAAALPGCQSPPRAASPSPAATAEPADMATEPPATDPPATEPPATEPPATPAPPLEPLDTAVYAGEPVETTLTTVTALADGTWERRYRNESVSYDGLTVELLSFDPEAEGAALRLRVTPPEEWDGELCAWLRRSGLRLSFEVDGRQVNAVREREITVLEDGRAFEVTYARCILDRYDRSGTALVIRPYVERFRYILSGEVVDGYFVQYDLAEGEEFVSVYQDGEPLDEGSRISKARVDRVYLDGAAVSAPLEGRPLDRPPVLHEVSFDVLDVERSIAAGAFEDGSQVPDIGTVYLREKDFSDVTLVLEEFHIWPEEIKLAFRLCYPPSWTDEECAAIAVDTGMLIYLDGYRPNERDIYNYASPSDCMGTYAGAMILSGDSYFRPPDDTYRDIMFANWKSTLTIEKWRNLESITIVPYYHRRLRANARPIPEEGYPYSGGVDWSSDVLILDELALTIEITDDLFVDGF